LGHGGAPIRSSHGGAETRLDCLQRGVGLRTIRAARLRHVGAATAAFAAQRRRTRLDEINRVPGLEQILGYTDREPCLAVVGDADNGDNPLTD